MNAKGWGRNSGRRRRVKPFLTGRGENKTELFLGAIEKSKETSIAGSALRLCFTRGGKEGTVESGENISTMAEKGTPINPGLPGGRSGWAAPRAYEGYRPLKPALSLLRG